MAGSWICPGCQCVVPDGIDWEDGESPCDCPPRRSVIVTVPMVPDSCLLPNQRIKTHYLKQHKHMSELRTAAKYAASESQHKVYAPVEISYSVWWPKGRRRPDVDAIPVACKPALDGIVDAGVITDDGPDTIVRVMASQVKDKHQGGFIEILISGLATDQTRPADSERGAM